MNVKQGDLAILIKSTRPENVGKICEVLEFAGHWENLGPSWVVEFTSPITRGTVTHLDTGLEIEIDLNQTKVLAADDWLRPISGLDDSDDTNETLNKPITEEEHV